MSEKELNVRIPQKIDTTSNWNSSTLILKDGEIGVEKLEDGSKKFKWGDGVNTWSNLPYATGEALNHILDGIANGSIRTSLSTAETLDYKLGTAAFAEGQGTKASGNFSHAEGFNTSATGAYSHAEGRTTTASGSVSHAEGTDSIASGIRSHAGGYGTIANGENQTAIGKYNVQDDTNEFAFIIGNGTSTARSNAFTVDWNGNVKANGKALATEEFVGQNGGSIDTIKVNGQNLTITEKSVNIEVPTKISELTNDSGFLTEHQDISGLAPKATTLAGYGITDAYTKTQADTAAAAQVSTAIGNLDKADTAMTGQYVSAVSETDGIIAVTRATLPDYSNTYDAKGAADAVLGTSTDTSTAATVYGVKALANSKVDSVTAADGSVTVGGTATAPTVGVKISETEGNALSMAADGLKVTVPTATDYTVTVTESIPEGYVKAYTIAQAATGLSATINIPRDMVVESGTVETKLTSGEWGLAGTYLILTLANATSDKVYIDVSTLIEYVTSGSGTNDTVQIVVSADHKVSATIKDGSIDLGKLSANVQASLNKADAAATQASVTTLETTVGAHTTKLAGIEEGANKTVVDAALSGTSTNPVQNKAVNIALSGKAANDLTNVDNATFKAKVESSGFSSGTVVQLVRWGAED